MSIEIRNIVKRFEGFTALNDVSLKVETGELVALLGPSGSGKTTLLRTIAGLEEADSGHIFFRGNDISERTIQDRRVGFVFQYYALFRHMNVLDNIAFGLRIRSKRTRPSEKEIREKVMALLKLVRLDGFWKRYPSQLSGGQRQRVALARALAIEPEVLLLDEPFGALDAKVRKELRQWLRGLHDKLHTTSLFVTHDQEEALELADRVVVMNEGRIEQMGTPDEVYHKPANAFVCNFLGNVNLFHCRLDNGKANISGTPFDLKRDQGQGQAQYAKIYVRPHLLEIFRSPVPHSFPAKILQINSAGPIVRAEVQSELGDNIQVEMTQERFKGLGLKKGDAVYVTLKDVQLLESDYAI